MREKLLKTGNRKNYYQPVNYRLFPPLDPLQMCAVGQVLIGAFHIR